MSLPRVTISDFSTAGDGITVSSSGIDVGDADANTPYVTLDDVAIYKHDLVILFVKKNYVIIKKCKIKIQTKFTGVKTQKSLSDTLKKLLLVNYLICYRK